jgi:hypothetical protein
LPRVDQFLFCEDARIEANGQLTLVRFFPGDIILLHQDGPLQLPKLTCVVVLKYMEGITSFSFQSEVSLGNEVVHRIPRVQQTRAGLGSHTLVIGYPGFHAARPGDYQFKTSIDVSGSVTTFSRRLRIGVGPGQGGGSVSTSKGN